MASYYDQYYSCCSTETALRLEIERLRERVRCLERVEAPAALYEVRLLVNDKWESTFKASDKIRITEHKYLNRNQDRFLYARH